MIIQGPAAFGSAERNDVVSAVLFTMIIKYYRVEVPGFGTRSPQILLFGIRVHDDTLGSVKLGSNAGCVRIHMGR